MDYLNQIGALITIALGLLGLISPQKAAKFVSLQTVGKAGMAEIRATYGGFFLALGIASLVLNTDLVFSVLGIAWIGAAIGRIISFWLDTSLNIRNGFGVVIELGIGFLCVL